MKRFFSISALCLIAFAPFGRAQDAATAAAIANRQEAEENYNKLKGTIEDLVAAQADQAKQIQALRKEIEDLRHQMSQPSTIYASAESLKQLADTVVEIDKKRVADNENILKEINKAASATTVVPARGNSKSGTEPGTSVPATDQNGFYYTVKKDDLVSLIAQAYRDQGYKVTSKQIEDANPNINPAKLRVGMKIFIPVSKPAAGK